MSWVPPNQIASPRNGATGRTHRMTAEERRAAKADWEAQIAWENEEYRERMMRTPGRSHRRLEDSMEQAHAVAEERRYQKSEWNSEYNYGSDTMFSDQGHTSRPKYDAVERRARAEERAAQIEEENRLHAERLANATSRIDRSLDPEVDDRRERLGLRPSSGQRESWNGAMPRAYLAPVPRPAWGRSPTRSSHDYDGRSMYGGDDGMSEYDYKPKRKAGKRAAAKRAESHHSGEEDTGWYDSDGEWHEYEDDYIEEEEYDEDGNVIPRSTYPRSAVSDPEDWQDDPMPRRQRKARKAPEEPGPVCCFA